MRLMTLAEYTHDMKNDFSRTEDGLVILPANALPNISFPEREMILTPWLKEGSLNMVFAARGVGKTHFALGLAIAVANGTPFLGWKVSRPAKVLYLDGEMCAEEMKNRMAEVGKAAFSENLALMCPDFSFGAACIPDLGTEDGRRVMEIVIESERPQLVIIDNKSCFMRSTRENNGDAWAPMQDFLIALKRRGISVLLVHHAGKDGSQRGSSRVEDVMETVIQLKHPDGYSPDAGMQFELAFTKARCFYGPDAQGLEVSLTKTPEGHSEWVYKPLSNTYHQAVKMLTEGEIATDIAEALGVHKGTVSKWKKKATQEGLLSPKT